MRLFVIVVRLNYSTDHHVILHSRYEDYCKANRLPFIQKGAVYITASEVAAKRNKEKSDKVKKQRWLTGGFYCSLKKKRF